MCRMVRMYQTARKGTAWHPLIPILHILDSSSDSNAESDLVSGAEDSSSEDYVPAGPAIEVPVESGGDEIHIIEPPPISIMDLVTALEEEEDRIEEEPEESEDSEKEDDLDLSEDTEGLVEFEELPLSFKEYRLRAIDKGKKTKTYENTC
jgi:hypothetical protein